MTISGSLPRPVVGLTSYLDPAVTEGCGTIEAAFLPQNYLAPVLAAGAIPVLLPPQGTDGGVLEQLLPRLDGVIVVGGWDVDPARYGAEPHTETDRPHRLRDAWDSTVVREAVRTDLPLLGICRGEQMLNVALGGSLHQHLPDLVGGGTYQPDGHRFTSIPVDIRSDRDRPVRRLRPGRQGTATGPFPSDPGRRCFPGRAPSGELKVRPAASEGRVRRPFTLCPPAGTGAVREPRQGGSNAVHPFERFHPP